MELIRVKNLSFGYQSKRMVLQNIDFSVKQGTFICIIGENGSGKSTLIKCILGLNRGYIGEIEKENKIGYLPQKTDIQANFPASVEEVVMSGTLGRHIRSVFYQKDDKKLAKHVMNELGIYEIKNKSFADLSGGQQQRVLIARAMCATDKIIILDEPTNGLDPSIALQIYTLLDELKRKRNLTILIVSHDVERALKFADNVIEIEKGKIKFNGTTQEYKKAGDIKW